MSSWAAEIRKRQADERHQERHDQKRQRDLERQWKERANLTALEEAQLEVERYDSDLDALLSVHKEQSEPIAWARFAAALPPVEPARSREKEFTALLMHGVVELTSQAVGSHGNAEEARSLDEKEHQIVLGRYQRELAEWRRTRALAIRVLAGDAAAYIEAVNDFSILHEFKHLGSSIQIKPHTPKLLECRLNVNGREAVPPEVKSLTAAGKLSVKAMPKLRFHEIYQDYVCGCVLRLAREILALLPVENVLVTASVHGINARTGRSAEVPVLSVAMTREIVAQLDFEQLDPSDSMLNFPHRGDVKASRKGGEFVPIIPLTPEDIAPAQSERMDFSGLLGQVRQLREQITLKLRSSPETDHDS